MKDHLIKYFMLVLMFTLSVETSIAQQDTIRSFPYFNGFEDEITLAGWQHLTTVNWRRTAGNVNNSVPGLFYLYSSKDDDQMVIVESPIFAFNNAKKGRISFDYNIASSSYDLSDLYVQIKVNGNDWISIIHSLSGSSNGWVTFDYDFDNIVPAQYEEIWSLQLKFVVDHSSLSYKNSTISIDNLRIEDSIGLGSPREIVDLTDVYDGVVTAMHAYGAEKAFDNSGSSWRISSDGSWITYDIVGCQSFNVTAYDVKIDKWEEAPARISLKGIDVYGQEFSIHSVNNLGWSDYQTKSFEIETARNFSKYKWYMSDTHDGEDMEIDEINLHGTKAYSDPDVLIQFGNTGHINYTAGDPQYDSRESKAWLIQPIDVSQVQLDFDLFELSCPSDYVRIYNGENRGAQLIGEYNTTYMPDVITSEGNSLYVEFLTTGAQGLDWAAGFSASYTSLDLEVSQPLGIV